MTGSDDATLVANAIKDSLTTAGQFLHPRDEPAAGQPYPTAATVRAQFWLARAQMLREMTVADAARYLREETLDALASAREAGGGDDYEGFLYKHIVAQAAEMAITTYKIDPRQRRSGWMIR